MAGTGDLAGLDLEVGHGVRARLRRQQQVAVELVGVGAGGGDADDDVADPDGVRLVALQGRLVEHPAAAARRGVVDQQAVLQVLAAVGEGDPAQLDIGARAGEVDGLRDANQVPAQGDLR